MWAFGKAAVVGFEAERWVASAIKTETVWEFASGAVVFAGRVRTVSNSSVEGGETDGGVNSAALKVLEPCVFVVVVLESAGWIGFLHLCNGKRLPQSNWQAMGVPVPLETNLVEPPAQIW